jgi:uncharacterized protein
MRLLRSFVIAFAWLAVAVSCCFAAPNFPELSGRVVDAAGSLDAGDKARLEQSLADYESSSGHQVVTAIVQSLEGYDIRDYGNKLFRQWAIGDAKRNDGVLLLIAPNERKVSIETGYGVEGDLTDAISRVIIDNAITPRFRSGDFAGGVEAGLSDIEKALGGGGKAIADRARQTPSGELTLADIIPLIFLLVFVFIVLSNVSRGGRRSRMIILPMPGGFGGGGWSSGGGGFGGGGFSGGGGSSGGGGASGSW